MPGPAWQEPGVISSHLSRHLGDGTVPNGLGINVHFTRDTIAQLEQIHAAGFRLVRTDLLWAEIEKEPGVYDWRLADELIRGLREIQLVPLFILAYSNPLYAPRLSGRPHTPSLAYAAPQHGAARAAFMAFAGAAAQRYGAEVIWEVWNEPDHNFGQPPDLRNYIEFAIEACRQIRAVTPDAAVIGPAASGFILPLLRNLLAADWTGCFDALSVHPYRDEPPESVLRDWSSLNAQMTQYGCISCPVLVSSEWGYSSVAGVLSQDRQAELVVREYLLNVIAGVPLSIVYDWQDDGPVSTDKEANFGLIDFSGRPKSAYHAIAQIANELTGLRYMGRVATGDQSEFVLAFGNVGVTRKFVGWSTSTRVTPVSITGRGPSLSQKPVVISPSESLWAYHTANAAVPELPSPCLTPQKCETPHD